MKEDFTTRPILRRIDRSLLQKYSVSYDYSIYLMILNVFLDGFFEAIENDEDVRIPGFGTFYVNGPQYAAYQLAQEMKSNGISDTKLIFDECSKVAYAEKVRINQYNTRPLLCNRGAGEKATARVYSIREHMVSQKKHFHRHKGDKVIVVRSPRLEDIINRRKLLNIKVEKT